MLLTSTETPYSFSNKEASETNGSEDLLTQENTGSESGGHGRGHVGKVVAERAQVGDGGRRVVGRRLDLALGALDLVVAPLHTAHHPPQQLAVAPRLLALQRARQLLAARHLLLLAHTRRI